MEQPPGNQLARPDSQGVLLRLQTLIHAFTNAERKVAEQVVQRPREVIYESVTELASQAGVGETSVLRFARRLGYRSYQDFKMDLARDVFSESPEITPADGGFNSLIADVSERHRRVIVDTDQLVDANVLDAVIDVLASARTIHFFGVGHSGIAAKAARYGLMRLGLRVDAADDSHFQVMSAAQLTEEDAAVGLSISGSTKDTVDSLRVAAEQGARTIAITAYAKAPIVRYAQMVLLTATREAPLEAGSFTSIIAQLHVLGLIATGLARKLPQSARQAQERIGRAVSPKLY